MILVRICSSLLTGIPASDMLLGWEILPPIIDVSKVYICRLLVHLHPKRKIRNRRDKSMRMKQNGNKRDIMATVIHNAEATASILNGQPVCLKFVGNAQGPDGLDVVLPSTAHTQNAGNEFTCLYGVALTNLPGGIPAG